MSSTRNVNKTVIHYSIAGAILMAITVLGTGILGVTHKLTGFTKAMTNYWMIWRPRHVQTPITYFSLVIILFAIALLIAMVVIAIVKKKYILIVPSVGLFLSIAFIPFILLAVIPRVEQGKIGKLAFYLMCAFTLTNLFAVLCYYLGSREVLKDGFGVFKKLAGGKEAVEEEEEEEKKEEPVRPQQIIYSGLREEEVRRIVLDYLEMHKEELHKEEKPVVEEKVQEPIEEDDEILEDDDEDEEEFEEVEEVTPEGTVIKIKRKKRVHFETKLKNSVFDLRHKYYDLRDYIKWYGLRNRVSIPGDTFSYKRKKYAFITISGKHIKFYAAIDPSKYEDSPIPVERATAKKYQDTPCLLRIKSDLSYRRAKAIVDAMMEEAGLEGEGPAPKETQHPEDK